MKELEKRKQELEDEKEDIEGISFENSFFAKWVYNFLLNRRSLGGKAFEHNISLADAQIVTRQGDGAFDPTRIFHR